MHTPPLTTPLQHAERLHAGLHKGAPATRNHSQCYATHYYAPCSKMPRRVVSWYPQVEASEAQRGLSLEVPSSLSSLVAEVHLDNQHCKDRSVCVGLSWVLLC